MEVGIAKELLIDLSFFVIKMNVHFLCESYAAVTLMR
jgi:hypothetical protein